MIYFGIEMERIVYVVLVLLFCDVSARNTRLKLVKLQDDVDNLRYQAIELRSDIDDIISWRNATIDNVPLTDEDTRTNEEPFRNSVYEKSMNSMESRIDYIIKGLSDEKLVLREMVSETSSKVREVTTTMQKTVENATKETDNKLSTMTANIKHLLESSMENVNAETAACKKRLDKLEIVAETNNNKLNTLKKGMSTVAELETDVKILKKEMVTGEEIIDATNTFKNELSVVDDKLVNVMRAVRALFVMQGGGWVSFRSSIYRHFDSLKTMTEAKKHCQEFGASVVQIDDDAELDFVMKQFGERGIFWIAGTDEGSEGEWKLPNGQLMTYTNWARGEPNNSGNVEDCIVFGWKRSDKSKWNDVSCSSQFRFICEVHGE